MAFAKKVVVLKQVTEGYSINDKPLCGICRLETEDEITTAFLSFVGIKATAQGEYSLFILCDKGNLLHFSLGNQPRAVTESFTPAVDLEKGFSAGLFFVKNDLPVLIAYRKTENFDETVKDLKTAVYDYFITAKKAAAKPQIIPAVPKEYNDEAVATLNYFDKKERTAFESLSTENDASAIGNQKETDKDKAQPFSSENEKTAVFGENDYSSPPYYLTVKKELDGIFARFPAEEPLSRVIAESKWARINYSENKFYVVGLIKEKGEEKYICYGVPSPYSETPPKALKGYCSFIPKSVFNLKGDGYFIMFQDAKTGKCIKPNEN